MSELVPHPEQPSADYLGIGVFETFLVHRIADGGAFAITSFERHWHRLRYGCERTGCRAPTERETLIAVRSACSRNEFATSSTLRARLIVNRGGWRVMCEPFEPLDPTAHRTVISVAAERSLPELKSCSSLVSVLAREEAVKVSAFEAILIDRTGIAREGAWSNFFWLGRDGRWRTPASQVLPGVTRSIVAEVLLAEQSLDIIDLPWTQILDEATEFFLTQATNGVVPIATLDTTPLSTTRSQSVQSRMQGEFVRLRTEF